MTCPACKRDAPLSGEVDVDGETLSVFQCETCQRPWCVDGETFQVALTFAVSCDGKFLDPDTLEPITLN